MKFLLVSECFLVRNSLAHLFKNVFDEGEIKSLSDLKEITKEDIVSSELLFLDSSSQQVNVVKAVKDIKSLKDIKIIILDIKKDKSLFLDLIKFGIDGYVLDICDEDDFKYIINKVMRGKKFFGADLLENYTPINEIKYSHLTRKEESIMEFISKGLSNKSIAKELNVTEYTIKKHVTSILYKLNLKNRQDIILYTIE
ncbi:two-component system response regulator NarL [Paraclostridium ghonii]|uniref:DNA-binding NarL/FixJ family response regulator n=1 Tax=Paraclostridium ghonii TaxID=29358 RepID=A0ABU0MWF1_9FIRM|nr:response regulator transcription factor [Paeniclostridium ghonii]MDQ0555225.1 DNA-binding NarL/FixJ family response regulator [Paeniclostridium ghonii]